jgi:alpha-mannosidase
VKKYLECKCTWCRETIYLPNNCFAATGLCSNCLENFAGEWEDERGEVHCDETTLCIEYSTGAIFKNNFSSNPVGFIVGSNISDNLTLTVYIELPDAHAKSTREVEGSLILRIHKELSLNEKAYVPVSLRPILLRRRKNDYQR